MNELLKQRIQPFKRHKRGYISFWIFGIVFLLSLFAEVLANDQPLLTQPTGSSSLRTTSPS